jgi:hypothetical protein
MNIYANTHRPINLLGEPGETVGYTIYSLLAMASVGVSAYHGAKRHGGSIGWAIGWGLLGGLFPIITPAVAVAQGLSTCKYDCK